VKKEYVLMTAVDADRPATVARRRAAQEHLSSIEKHFVAFREK